MKLVFIILFFLQLPAIAGTDWAVQFCNKYRTSGLQKLCLEDIVEKEISDAAVKICDRYPIETNEGMTKGSCLDLVVDKEITVSTVKMCGELPSGLKSGCLEDITGKEINDAAFKICDKHPIETNEGMTKGSCLELIAGKAMNDAAVKICDRYPIFIDGYGTTKMECLEVIIKICDKHPVDEDEPSMKCLLEFIAEN